MNRLIMAGSLSQQILVLNRLWQAVNIVSVKRGFSLLIQDHARVIYTGDESFLVMDMNDWVLHSENNKTPDGGDSIQTVRYSLRIPKVLLLKGYDKMPSKEVKFNRRSIFERDNYCCQYCAKTFEEKELNLDHVIPRDQGGKTSWENIVTSCIHCNSKKANRMPHQARMKILRRPMKPRWRPFASLDVDPQYVEHWQHFMHQSQCDT